MKKTLLFVSLYAVLTIQAVAQNVGIGNTAPLTRLDINGDVAFRSADITITSTYTYALDVNTVKQSHYKLKQTLPVGNFILAGITAGTNGRMITLTNYTGTAMEIYDEDATANANDRIKTGIGTTLAVYPNGSIMLQYDVPEQRWLVKGGHNNSLSYFGGGSGGTSYWDLNGANIFNNNTGNVGIGTNTPNRAKFEVYGVANTSLTTAIFGGDGNGLSFQRNWPTIGFNQYRDVSTGWGKALSNGYGMHMFFNPANGSYSIAMQDSVAANAEFVATPKNAITTFKNGYVHIGSNNMSDQASLSISGGSNFPSHFNYGSDGHSYIRGGDRIFSNIGFARRPSKVFINDIPGQILATGANTAGGDVILVTGGGNVGIGTENTAGYKLAVNGNVRSKEVVVETGWADYVFEEDYLLPTLESVEQHIKINKHLPGIPSALSIQKNGLNLGAVQTKMMEKIEELTLYVIALKKEIESIKSQK
ncbi:MAG: hypothetical protein V4722_26920 [Bacteroidota bacterium]